MTTEQILQELDPELRPHLFHHKIAGPSIAHPLIKMMSIHVSPSALSDTISPSMASTINAILREKRELRNKTIDEKDWLSYIFLHERYARFQALLDCIKFNDFETMDLWSVIGEVWQDTESAWSNREQWVEIWSDPCPRRWNAMSQTERNALRRLPDVINIWRGVSDRKAMAGLSWTLNRGKAEWFARRWTGTDGPMLVCGQIKKADVRAYFKDRREREIVALPGSVKNLNVTFL